MAGHDRDNPARLRYAEFFIRNRAMHTSRRLLSRKLDVWSRRIWEVWNQVVFASAGGERVHCYDDFAWHYDGGPAEWLGPVPSIVRSSDTPC
ncbi:hypothetical protein CG716_13660 [Mycolicibacterium sphagni]|uniref:Uncharacterized protein n=2 Tax=Mycolicibacterium sphagni TaxID=1786 RepID=A0A255DII0_9MYCO|nr:hypothetical protein CG716_13660 [Mycolicibacterium sphagni]